jgi:hypothetical protein
VLPWDDVKTIGIDLWAGQVRGDGRNVATMMRPAQPMPRGVAPMSARDLFLAGYAKLACQARCVEEPGLAILAMDERTGRPAGMVKLIARVGRPVAAIVGRHDRCDLFLQGNERLALRQLAIVLDPVTSWRRGDNKVRYRVMDLRTHEGMIDEEGRLLRGLRAEGPAVLRLAGYTLFITTLGDPTDYPELATDAWQMMPERVYFDELAISAGGSLPAMRLPNTLSRGQTRQSVIIRTHGPRDTNHGIARAGATDDVAGSLEIVGPHRSATFQIGQVALRDGVLIGRYDRCDAASAIDDASMSRVHALLVQEEDRLIIIDTSSCNGTRILGSENARVNVIEPGCEIGLGKHTIARWRWLS